MRGVLLLLALTFSIGSSCASAEQTVWALGGVHFGHECPNDNASCVLAHVASRDGKKIFVARRSAGAFHFEVLTKGAASQLHPAFRTGVDSDESYVEMGFLWAPDSSAFSLSWNETAITERSEVYVVGPQTLRKVDLTFMMRDFAKRFPPCVSDPAPCEIDRHGRFYNYLTVAWAAPHTVVMMAEVPPSSSWGRNLGEVSGYEVNALTGSVVRVMTAAEFKRRWQSHMGWNSTAPNAE